MKATRSHTLAGLVVTLWWTLFLTSCPSLAFDGLHGYDAINPEVADIANIARDLQAMHEELKYYRKEEEGITRAYSIYKHGGYSRSVCTIRLASGGLEHDVKAGETFEGKATNGETVRATAESNYNRGTQQITLLYKQDVPCNVGGLPEDRRRMEGCLVPSGMISYGKEEKNEIAYSYDPNMANTNERTIQAMSVNAGRKFRQDGLANRPFFHDFQKFVDYYGEAEFGDKMITAAMTDNHYTFPEGEFDFSGSTKEAREDFIELFASYLNIGLFIISELENALEKCADHCQHGDCHHAAIHAVDAAVAFYVGSLQAEDPEENGNLLYGLANRMCARHRTCGRHGNKAEGVAKVNYDIFNEFNEMKHNLNHDMCVDARKNKEAIIKHMFIPMVQGFRFAVYRRHVGEEHTWGKEYKVEDAAPFSAAVLPLLGYCKMEEAKNIQVNFDPGHVETTEDLVEIEENLAEHYECMGICCSDVGGLWDHQRSKYYHNAAPCKDTWAHCFEAHHAKTEEETSHMWMLYVLLAAIVVTGVLYRRRLKAIKRRKRAEATGEYEDDSDNSSIDSDEGGRFA